MWEDSGHSGVNRAAILWKNPQRGVTRGLKSATCVESQCACPL